MLKVLVLEDELYCQQVFRQACIGCNSLITSIAQEAIEAVEKTEFDLIFIDHDLMPAHYDLRCASATHSDTGYALALWLEEHSEKQAAAQIVIHSLNPVGQHRILKALRDRPKVMIIPFDRLCGMGWFSQLCQLER